MSEQSYEIVCPICKSVVPSDAARCPTCAATAAAEHRARAATANVAVMSPPVLAAAAPAARPGQAESDSIATGKAMEGASTLNIKDYHRMVRENYGTVQGRGGSAAFGNPLVPILLIVALVLVIGAAFAFHWI